MHFAGFLYIMDLINVQMMEHVTVIVETVLCFPVLGCSTLHCVCSYTLSLVHIHWDSIAISGHY